MVLADLQHLPLYCTSRLPACELAVGGKERTGKRERGEDWSAQFGMPFPACEDGARSFKGHTSKNLHRSGTLCTLISFREDRKRKRKRGRGRKVHRLTRGSIRLAVVATKYQLLISLDASTSDSSRYVYSANKLHAIE